MISFEERYKKYYDAVNAYLSEKMNSLTANKQLVECMRYATVLGGKRIRPVLFLAFLDAFHVDYSKYASLAVAIECIHCFSLVHDDLPAMDNDDFRRGKPSAHKAFGEATAILAGDALLNYAYELCLEDAESVETYRAGAYLSKCAGYRGMIDGQAYDLEYQFSVPDEQILYTIDSRKTSALIKAPIVMAGIIANVDLKPLELLGEKMGLIFQFVDDLLDVVGDDKKMGKTLGKDEIEGKTTAVSVYGIKKAKEIISLMVDECNEIIDGLGDYDLEFIRDVIKFFAKRSN